MSLHAGTCEVVISPPVGTLLASATARARRVHVNLHARALVLREGTTHVALVSVDLFGFPLVHVKRVQARVHVLTNGAIPPDNVFIAASHTHNAGAVPYLLPSDTAISFGDKQDPAEATTLLDALVMQVAGCVEGAFHDLQPCEIRTVAGRLPGITHNRRIHDPHARDVDEALDAIIVSAPGSGEMKAAWYTFGAHPVTMMNTPSISADYPGLVAKLAKGQLGESVAILFGNGACGNVNPGPAPDAWKGLPGEAACERLASALWASLAMLVQAAREAPGLPVTGLSCTSLVVHVDVVDEGLVESFPFMSVELVNGKHVIATRVSGIRLGKTLLLGLPGEPIAAISLDLKERCKAMGYSHVIVVENVNDFIGYWFTPESYRAGGYETLLSGGEREGPVLVEAALAVASTLRGA